MSLKNKFVFYILLFLAIFLVIYLVVQIIIPEPLTEKLSDLANPPTEAAYALITAYLENQPKKVAELLTTPCRNRIWHSGALEAQALQPDQAMQEHTAKINGHCLEKIDNKTFVLVQTESSNPDQLRFVVHAGTKDAPGAAVLELTMLKEKDGNWRCEQIVKIP